LLLSGVLILVMRRTLTAIESQRELVADE